MKNPLRISNWIPLDERIPTSTGSVSTREWGEREVRRINSHGIEARVSQRNGALAVFRCGDGAPGYQDGEYEDQAQ